MLITLAMNGTIAGTYEKKGCKVDIWVGQSGPQCGVQVHLQQTVHLHHGGCAVLCSRVLCQPGGGRGPQQEVDGGQAGAGDQDRAGERRAAGPPVRPRHHHTGAAVVVRGLTAAAAGGPVQGCGPGGQQVETAAVAAAHTPVTAASLRNAADLISTQYLTDVKYPD